MTPRRASYLLTATSTRAFAAVIAADAAAVARRLRDTLLKTAEFSA